MKNNGFTIVELLIYIGLLFILMTVLVELFVSVLKLQLTTQSTSASTQDIRFILSRFSYDLGGAGSILVPGNLGQTSDNLRFLKDGVLYSYSLDTEGKLLLNVGGSSDSLNGLDSKIENISFKRLGFLGGKPMIQIVFSVGDQTIQTTYGLR